MGQLHKCSPKKETIHNLKQCIPKKLQEQFSASVVKEKASGSKDTILSTFGKPLNLSIGKRKSKEEKSFTHDDVMDMQRDMKLSDRNTLKMAKHIRDRM